jgi:aminoglycoside phosphotransferase family enzyme
MAQLSRCLLSSHLKTETDPVSETLCSSVCLEYRTMDKVKKPNSPEYCDVYTHC